LRRLRDEILAVDEQGSIYIDTYYRHGWELFLILLTSEELRREAREIVEAVRPVSQSLLSGREALMSRELSGKVTTFLEKIAWYAHPRFKAALNDMKAHLQRGELWERFGITITDNP